ncbi:MAG TPA: polyprenol phosphomannose-dependent alpha 1,6 mannosyltransferase MptB, partial [Acidimicrobiales bacterium]|nr:polyprenol phosphomannose-dependent alpha 1,6 mannosyltransferase MptB [Acidimicrobiales bacterium]
MTGESSYGASAVVPGGRTPWLWGALGFLGSTGLAVAGVGVGAVPDLHQRSWGAAVPVVGGRSLCLPLFYCSLAVLVAAWVGVGRRARARLLRPGEAWSLLVVWALPLFLGPPLFSRDLYSYVAQGTLAHVGLDPYSVGPSALGPGHLLTSVAPTWR